MFLRHGPFWLHAESCGCMNEVMKEKFSGFRVASSARRVVSEVSLQCQACPKIGAGCTAVMPFVSMDTKALIGGSFVDAGGVHFGGNFAGRIRRLKGSAVTWVLP